VKYALEEEITPEVKAGLLYYSSQQINAGKTWGRQPGRLFGAGEPGSLYIHTYLEPEFRWGWGSASVLVLIIGIRTWFGKPLIPRFPLFG
jgi:hypothetical protein